MSNTLTIISKRCVLFLLMMQVSFTLIYAETPSVTFFSPQQNLVSSKPLVLFKGTVKNTSHLTLNNTPVTIDNKGRFYTKVTLEKPNEYHYFILSATSESGKIAKYARKIFYKTSDTPQPKSSEKKPLITLVSPDDNIISSESTVMVSGHVQSAANLLLNGVTINVSQTGHFNHPYLLKNTNDYNSIVLLASSKTGNMQTSVKRRIYYKHSSLDEVAIMLKSPEHNLTSTADQITFSGTISGKASSLTINNEPIKISPNGTFVHTVPLSKKDGPNLFSLVAQDSEGKQASVERAIFYKPSSAQHISTSVAQPQPTALHPNLPEITLTSPQNNFVTYKDFITLTGSIAHAKEVYINNRIITLDSSGGFSEVFELDTLGKYIFNIYAVGDQSLNATHLLKVFRISKNQEPPHKKSSHELEKKLSKLISIDLVGADLRDVMSILSRKGALNMVTDKSLEGEIYVSLHDVQVIDAIDFVLSSQGFSYKIVDNTIIVGTQAILEQPSRLETQIIRLNNLKPDILKPIIAEYLVQGEAIQTQENVVILTVDSKKMSRLLAIIQQLDSDKVPQIVLEAHILEVTKSALDNLGIAWPSTISSGLEVAGTGGTLAYTTNISGLTAIINTLETEGKGRVIAKPRIKVIHGQQAEIFIGDKIPYVELLVGAAGTVAESVKYVDAGIQLKVLPEINVYTQEIKIEIAPEVSYINGYSGQNNDIPIVRTRRVDTTVYVKNSNTVLIGGLFNSSDSDTVAKLPFLHKLPFIGSLFQSSKEEKDHTELVIAITPKIIDETYQESIPVTTPGKS